MLQAVQPLKQQNLMSQGRRPPQIAFLKYLGCHHRWSLQPCFVLNWQDAFLNKGQSEVETIEHLTMYIKDIQY